MKPAAIIRRSYTSRSIAGLTLSDIGYAEGHRQSSHWHPYSAITLIVSGVVEERGPSGVYQARPASVVVKPAGTIHSNLWGPAGTRTLRIAWNPTEPNREQVWGKAFERYHWTDGGPLAATIICLYRLFAGAEVSAELALEECLCEITAILDGEATRSARNGRPAWLDRVVDRLSDQAARSPRVAELAAEAGVHPVYLARAFRRHNRCSISEYLRRQRVGEVCRRLATSSASIAAIALEAGFADQPHLCRVFRAEMGITPATYRKVLRGD